MRRSIQSMMAVVLGASLVAPLSACRSERKPQAFPLTISAQTDEGEPLPGVEMILLGRSLGKTNPEGKLRGVLRGFEGDSREFEVKCPTGFQSPKQPAAIQLRTVQGGASAEGSELSVVCGADKRVAALVVRANGFADLPVLVHGREVGRTDATGTAHVLLKSTPGQDMRVLLDTRAYPYVVPANPHKDVRIPNRDDVILFSAELKENRPEPKRKVVKAAKPETFRPERVR